MILKKMKARRFPGAVSPEESERERKNRGLARRFAAEGMVLLKNEGRVLPLREGSRVALYGAGASKTVKGGTGSGDVNSRRDVSVCEGLKNAGFEITTEKWIADYDRLFERKRLEWRDGIVRAVKDAGVEEAFNVYARSPFRFPVGGPVEKTDADTAFFILSRIAGEGADRSDAPGDYRLSPEEEKLLDGICAAYGKVVVVLNAGGPVDLSFLDAHPNVLGLIQMSQAGTEGGNALADLVSGKANFSGKLTDTWAFRYGDYPSSETFSHNDGDTATERYGEGIYVGYRYFDTFSVPARYGFGYGLSYTTFEIAARGVSVRGNGGGPRVEADVEVRNTGGAAGREVVQIYASCPDGKLEKEFRRLAAFGKTKLLQPGESQRMKIGFPLRRLASYDEAEPGWVLEPGGYGVWIGDSLGGSRLTYMLRLDRRAVTVKTRNLCAPKEKPRELSQDAGTRAARYAEWKDRGVAQTVEIRADEIAAETADCSEPAQTAGGEAGRLARELTDDELIRLVVGDPGRAQGSNLGSAGISVPGAAGETGSCEQGKGLASIVLADGPAGLRLNPHYDVADGKIVPMPFLASFERGLFAGGPDRPAGTRHYQYCTAIPVGTLLAQTWDAGLLREAGRMVGGEMQDFGVTLWLAPGMNIHRNPLCGRNFEYYSEDPLLSGVMAAAITAGVQSEAGCGTTIKHFACNSQEDNRMGSDSVVSERALREIYLKGFEIAVRSAQPMAIMTSYNLVNGVHAANNRGLCTGIARREWGFRGLIMTDWTTTEHGADCTAAGCVRAGNDLVMPGSPADFDNLRAELAAGTLKREDLERCAARVINIVLQSNRYEGARAYGEQLRGAESRVSPR